MILALFGCSRSSGLLLISSVSYFRVSFFQVLFEVLGNSWLNFCICLILLRIYGFESVSQIKTELVHFGYSGQILLHFLRENLFLVRLTSSEVWPSRCFHNVSKGGHFFTFVTLRWPFLHLEWNIFWLLNNWAWYRLFFAFRVIGHSFCDSFLRVGLGCRY